MIAMLLAVAHAGCGVVQGPDEVDGIPVLRASCVWSGVDVEAVDALLSDIGAHHRFIWTIGAETVLHEAGDETWVHQRHVVPFTRPREATVRIRRTALSDGGVSVTWRLADEQPPPAAGAVAVLVNDGAWTVMPTSDGVSVELELAYSPGGAVPDFVVRWVQGAGARRVLDDLRLAAVTPRRR